MKPTALPSSSSLRGLRIKFAIYLTLLALMIIAALIPCVPVLLKLFVPYPKLEDARVLDGHIEVVGEGRTTGGRGGGNFAPPTYYIVNASGRHKFFCGYYGRPIECQSRRWFETGMRATVWFHPLFGTLQYQIHEPEDRVPKHLSFDPYDAGREHFRMHFNWKKFNVPLFRLVMLIIVAYLIVHWYRDKRDVVSP